jgi:hypothetical protein
MSLVPVNVTWKIVSGSTNGSTWQGDGLWFDTVTRLLSTTSQQRVLATLDPRPTDVHLLAGDYVYSECAPDFTLTTWLYDGQGATTTTVEPNSAFCGYTAPLSCDLGIVTVKQTTTATGVTLTVVAGGNSHGQPAYSLDGGAEQSSPYFTGVAVGKHQVRMRDTGVDDCLRLVDVEVAAAPVGPVGPVLPPAPTGPSQRIDFVGQPLWYPLFGYAAGTLAELELWAESSHSAGDYALVLTQRKRFDVARQVTFRLDTLLWPLLSAFVPPVEPTATVLCTTNLCNYYVRTTVTPLDPAQTPVPAVSQLRTALRGALPAEWRDRDYFNLRLGAAFPAPPFLSWQPYGPGSYAAGQPKLVVYGQPEWLCLLCPLIQTNAQLRVRRAYSMTPTGTPAVDYELLTQPALGGWSQRVLAIPLLPTRPGFQYLTVRVETLSGTVLSQEAVYQFVEASPRTRYLHFTNSLGGLDTLRCEGRLEATLESTAGATERPVRLGYSSPAADQQVSDLSASRKLKLATGWLTPAELDWLQDLVLSREVWHQVGAQLRPLDWSKRSLATYSDEPTLRGLLLECDYAYAPTAYAPVPYA